MSTLTGQWSLQKFGIFTKPNIYICEKPEFHTSEIEILWLEVIINNLKAMVGVIYRPVFLIQV
jgi:hypothetical protein